MYYISVLGADKLKGFFLSQIKWKSTGLKKKTNRFITNLFIKDLHSHVYSQQPLSTQSAACFTRKVTKKQKKGKGEKKILAFYSSKNPTRIP